MEYQNASVEIRKPERAPVALGGVDDRRRLERDLHDGAQNELVEALRAQAFRSLPGPAAGGPR